MSNNTIGVFSGRMQVLTKKHRYIIDLMSKENYKSIIFLVKGKKTSLDKDRNPLDLDIQLELLESFIPSNIEIKVINTGYYIDELNKYKDTTFNIYAGSDRINQYRSFSGYIENNNKLIFKEIRRTNYISGTNARKALITRNRSMYERISPKETHNMYNKLLNYF